MPALLRYATWNSYRWTTVLRDYMDADQWHTKAGNSTVVRRLLFGTNKVEREQI
ncbi:MAG: hypothetical protein JO266_11085 [Acidobacteria bacterium]|nr:hypothetical protein [Acidobacteriota bacterium]